MRTVCRHGGWFDPDVPLADTFDAAANVQRQCEVCRRGQAPAGPPPDPPAETVGCLHEGPEVSGQERQLLGLPHGRVWRKCHHPSPPLGENVCPCAGCGPTCPKYAPADGSPRPLLTAGGGVLVTGGIGDFITVEGQLTPEEREAVEAVYYAAPAAAEIEALFRALPTYPRLKSHVVLPTGGRVLYERAEVESAVGYPLPANVRDLSIRKVFPLAKPYTGSSLLLRKLTVAPHPGRPYAVVVPHSTWFSPPGRAFDAADWETLFRALDRHDLVGVVLCREKVPIPDHPRLIDWQERLSILQAVEVLKAADGYLGIDSWCSVLAAKLFSASRLWIKSTWSHGWENRLSYWGPRTSFPFVSSRLEVPPWN